MIKDLGNIVFPVDNVSAEVVNPLPNQDGTGVPEPEVDVKCELVDGQWNIHMSFKNLNHNGQTEYRVDELIDSINFMHGTDCLAGISTRQMSIVPDTYFSNTVNLSPNKQIKRNESVGTSWISGPRNAIIKDEGTRDTSLFFPVMSTKSNGGYWSIGTLNDSLAISHVTDSDYASGNNTGNNFYISPNAYPYTAYKQLNSYPGLCLFDGSDTGYFRTPKEGLIPYQSGGSSYLGTSGWPFNYIYGKAIYQNGSQVANVSQLPTPNNVLWSGCYYMNASQVVTLSQAVSSQRNGIVLFWSYYAGDNTNNNSDICLTYVPKSHVANHPGKGVITCCCTTAGTWGWKYTYVSNTTISGNACNTTSNNTKWTLAKVYGV